MLKYGFKLEPQSVKYRSKLNHGLHICPQIKIWAIVTIGITIKKLSLIEYFTPSKMILEFRTVLARLSFETEM